VRKSPLHTSSFLNNYSYPQVSLAEAREQAKKLVMDAKQGINLKVKKRAQRSALLTAAAKNKTFRECAVAYMEAHSSDYTSDKHRKQWPATLETYPFFASQKSIKLGFSANSLAQTFALLYEGAELEGASSHSGRRTFLTNLANKGTAIHILKTLAGHRSISTTAAYLYSSPSQLKATVELV